MAQYNIDQLPTIIKRIDYPESTILLDKYSSISVLYGDCFIRVCSMKYN